MPPPSLPPQQPFRHDFTARKLLFLHNPLHQAASAAPPPFNPPNDRDNLSGNVVMVLSVLICGVICSLGLHYIIRCLFRCSSSLLMLSPNPSSEITSPAASKGGVRKKALKTFPIVCYSLDQKNLPGLDSECVICLSEFTPGERLRVLPNCNHTFHVDCVDKWLVSHSSCPKCRRCLNQTCQNNNGAGGCSSGSRDSSSGASEEEGFVSIEIVPLQPERMINIRTD